MLSTVGTPVAIIGKRGYFCLILATIYGVLAPTEILNMLVPAAILASISSLYITYTNRTML